MPSARPVRRVLLLSVVIAVAVSPVSRRGPDAQPATLAHAGDLSGADRDQRAPADGAGDRELPRVLPNESEEDVRQTLIRVLANDKITVTPVTDSRYLRAAGIPAYGAAGTFGDVDDIRAHARDERLLVQSLYEGQEYLDRLAKVLWSRP